MTTYAKNCEVCAGVYFRRSRSSKREWERRRFCSLACNGMAHKAKASPPRERFWPKVERGKPDQCWPWTGAIGLGGYGNFGWSKQRTVNAHKAAFILDRGAVPTGMVVMHRCDNRVCCNPAHLTLGTHRDNTQDAIAKGRMPQCAGAKP